MKAASCALCAGLVLVQIAFGAAVRCYICSWSPDDSNNRTDACTDNNFQKNYIHSEDCKGGCEVFIQWDSNERMEHLRRNCADGENGVEACKEEKNNAWARKRCMCSSDLCNNNHLSGTSAMYANTVTTWVLTTVALFAKLRLTRSI